MSLNRLAAGLLSLPRAAKRLLALSVDASLCALALWAAYGLRLETWTVGVGVLWLPLLSSWVLALPVFVAFGMYRAIFRYSGWLTLMTVVKAFVVYGVLFAGVFSTYQVNGVPRTVGLLQPLLLFLLIAGSRIAARFWLGEIYQNRLERKLRSTTLIYGAGAAGRQLAEVLSTSRQLMPIGFVDDDAALQGHTINGLRVYPPRSLASIIMCFGVTELLLAIPSASRVRRNEILQSVQTLSVKVRTLPAMLDLAHGRVKAADIRDLEIDDLLARDPVAPDAPLMNKNILGKVVLVTGAGGSIGSELCRQILLIGPASLLLIESSEFALYSVHQDLLALQASSDLAQTRIIPLLASVRDYKSIEVIMCTWKPHTVYHAAAYKHVPLVEHNPAEGVRNNVLGTFHTARAAAQNMVGDFVLISTDKAVRPTNIMGASKRLAELVLQGLASAASLHGSTRFSMVRFGNVLGSSGSVVPLFRRQIRSGGPVTITHPDITRYFMTIPEAAQLVIQASAMAGGGDVFVLDMGEPVRISDLAYRVVQLSGLTVRDAACPDGDIEIVVTGMRPGEKLHEELLIGNHPEATQHPLIMKAHEPCLPWPQLLAGLASLEAALALNDVGVIRQMLKGLVPEYEPATEIVDWVHLQYMDELIEVNEAARDTGQACSVVLRPNEIALHGK